MKKKEIMNRKKKRLTFQLPEEKSSFKSGDDCCCHCLFLTDNSSRSTVSTGLKQFPV